MDTELQHSIVSTLAAKYPVFAVTTIERWVTETIDSFGSAQITKYLPILVRRSVEATLTELARIDGTSTDLLSISKMTNPGKTLELSELAFWPASTSVQNGVG